MVPVHNEPIGSEEKMPRGLSDGRVSLLLMPDGSWKLAGSIRKVRATEEQIVRLAKGESPSKVFPVTVKATETVAASATK